jgi:hypothetical protein
VTSNRREFARRFERSAVLDAWFDTRRPGFYAGRGTYAVRFLDPNLPSFDAIWVDVLAGDFGLERRP